MAILDQKTAVETSLRYKAFDIAVRLALPPLVSKNMTIVASDLDKGLYTIKTWIAAKRHPEVKRSKVVRFESPRTVWQHFKVDYFPEWLLRAFPAQYDVVVENVEWLEGPIYVCPHLRRVDDAVHLDYLNRQHKTEGEQ